MYDAHETLSEIYRLTDSDFVPSINDEKYAFLKECLRIRTMQNH